MKKQHLSFLLLFLLCATNLVDEGLSHTNGYVTGEALSSSSESEYVTGEASSSEYATGVASSEYATGVTSSSEYVTGVTSSSSHPVDSLKFRVYFRQSISKIDPSYKGNADNLAHLYATIIQARQRGLLESIQISAYASPEGASALNKSLAFNRTSEIARLISSNCNVPIESIKQTSGGVGWYILHGQLQASNEPYAQQVISMIENIPVHILDSRGNLVSSRRKQLMELEGGKIWNDMYQKYFPDIRCCMGIVIITAQEAINPIAASYTPASAYTSIATRGVETKFVKTTPIATEPEYTEEGFIMGLKTNMLYDAALVPNIGAEFYLGNRWTLGADWMYAWWKNDKRHHYWRIYGGDLTIRKYFGKSAQKGALQGHHAGIYGQIFTADFELGGKGVISGQPGGTIFDKLHYGIGLEYGYSLPVARKFNIDFTFGIGYIGGEYSEYKPIDDCYVWQATKNRNYIGPTKAEISLVWLIGKENPQFRKGGRR